MENNPNLSTDFSGVPSLNDDAGLASYLENENLKAMGIQPTVQENANQNIDLAKSQEQLGTEAPIAPGTTEQPIAPTVQPFTSEQVKELNAKFDAINARLDALNKPAAQTQTMQPAYTASQKEFIITALNKGYTMDQINAVLKAKSNNTPSTTDQRIAGIENYLKAQEYKAAESAFINKLSTFGDKWGLSEQDLVTFGETAMKQGINIATPNIDLETVFRAVYPQQYAIRAQRMQPTSTSQIFGGTSATESSRAMSAKQEDAYVEAFLKQSMPNYGKK